MDSTLSSSAHSLLQKRWRAVNATLEQFRPLWQFNPFKQPVQKEANPNSDLLESALALTDDQAENLDSSTEARQQWLREREPEIASQLQELALPLCNEIQSRHRWPARDMAGIPGRKWAQIEAFTEVLAQETETLRKSSQLESISDWCAGKGYLARLLHKRLHLPVDCLEWDETLCASGSQYAQAQSMDIRFHHCNVLESVPSHLSGSRTLASALHACGDLHEATIRHAIENKSPVVAVAPCCYHKIAASHYRIWSQSVRAQSSLFLDRDDLHFATAEMHCGGQRSQRLHTTEKLWRLGFDELQRRWRGVDEYLPVPSAPKSLFTGSFEEFCRWAAQRKQIPMGDIADADALLRRARQRQGYVKRLEIVRKCFRETLEHWLLLDRAILLEENGYGVDILSFCATEVSPRNRVLIAKRR